MPPATLFTREQALARRTGVTMPALAAGHRRVILANIGGPHTAALGLVAQIGIELAVRPLRDLLVVLSLVHTRLNIAHVAHGDMADPFPPAKRYHLAARLMQEVALLP